MPDTTDPTMSQEIELKLSLPKSAVAALRRHPLFSGAPLVGPHQTLINTYFDTPALLLKSRRIALRTRKQGRVWLQTVKCGGECAGGLSHRPEWEHPYHGAFDFGPVDAHAVQALLEAQRPHLQPVFTTTFRRETRRYTPQDGVDILLMLDLGTVEAAGRSTPLCELELELVAGGAGALFDLALALAADLPLVPEDLSKAQRGYLLFLDQALAPVKSRPSPIQAGDHPLAAFNALALDGLRQWQANARGAAESDNPEFIHQMRVALRRLRCLLRIMGPALPTAFVVEWLARLGDEAQRLGHTRDMDVLLSTILAPVEASDSPPPGLAGLRRQADKALSKARHLTRASLAQGDHGRTLLAFGAALHGLASGTATPPADGLAAFAHQQLERLRKRARRRLADVRRQPGSDTFHALRIALKHLRYGLDFFFPLCKPNRAKQLLADIDQAQDDLGFLHDLAMARAHLRTWAGNRSELREAAAFVAGYHAYRSQHVASRTPAAVERLLKSPVPVKLP